MKRCIQLAKLGAGSVAPNPMVGAVLVCGGKIIGEGFHEVYGGAHAEVNCINNVSVIDADKICESILYVSLEPCAHYGKTPPCVDLIIANKIPHVVIGCRDSFKKVNGAGIEKLLTAGIRVEKNILETSCLELNKRFFTFHKFHRPYIILKWAQTNDGFIDHLHPYPLKISNGFTDILTHKWRAEEAAILAGTNTVLKDNPSLTVRNWKGNNPVRIIIDLNLSVKNSSSVYKDDVFTIIINKKKEGKSGNALFYKIKEENNFINEIVNFLYQNAISSCIIEGGAKTLQLFIDSNLWDEAGIITNTSLIIHTGVASPILLNPELKNSQRVLSDKIEFFTNNHNELLPHN